MLPTRNKCSQNARCLLTVIFFVTTGALIWGIALSGKSFSSGNASLNFVEAFYPPTTMAPPPTAVADRPPTTAVADCPPTTAVADHPPTTSVADRPSHLTEPMCSGPTKGFPHTNCVADFTFVNIWAQFRPSSLKSWTFVDVGANKGYTIVALLQAIGNKKYTAMGNHDNLVRFAKKENMSANVLCGACHDCKEVFHPYGTRYIVKGVVPKAKIYAFDPIRSHAKYLNETFASDDNVTFTVRQVALSNQTGVTKFGAEGNSFGNEDLGVSSSNNAASKNKAIAPQLYEVPVSMLTKELQDEKLDFIDVLLTDTEGNDFKVADGAAEWIFAGKVGLYIFEIHRDSERNLGTHIRRLEESGYRCFAPIGGGGATQISHECWNPEWENVAGWINVICANERLPHLMEAMYVISTFLRPSGKH